ncbi:MAG TPA: XRE family transcriptional regulator [Anaerolineae bacterium]|nr:XRE family transcriptional regulator [Anaerolineae bacterium]
MAFVAGRAMAEADAEIESLGARLRALRAQHGITLSQMGRMVGLSASYLSQIERDKAHPSLTTLSSIANTLGVELRSFFEHPQPVWQVVRKGAGEEFGDEKALFELLSSAAVRGKIEPCRVTCRPAMRTERGTHSGEELLLILEGQLEIGVGEEAFTLEAGDSIHYQGSQPHYWYNQTGEDCSLIWAVSPPLLAFRRGEVRGTL